MSEIGREPSPYKVQSGDHALLVGFVVGMAMKRGLPLELEVDEDGNLAASAKLILDEPYQAITVRIIVDAPLEPPQS